MNRLHSLVARPVLLLFCLSAGCVSLDGGYPEKRYFVVELAENSPRSNSSGDQTLMVSGLRVSPRYADKSFVYRISDSGYEADFYNQFLTSPETMLGEEVRKGLAASPAFKYVVGASSQLQPNYVLEGSVNALYGDFRNLDKPAAVLEIEFFLHNEDSHDPGIVLQKRYMKSVPINGRTPDALVKGWSQALQAILTDLNGDLQKIKS